MVPKVLLLLCVSFAVKSLCDAEQPKCSLRKGIFGYISCSTMSALKTVKKADEEASFEILPGVSLVKEAETKPRLAKELKLEELPTDSKMRAGRLAEMLVEASAGFLSERALKVSLPKINPVGVSRALEEGRAKMKKLLPLILGMGAKMATTVSLLFGSLALISSKALIVGKLALIVSVVVLLQYLFGTGRGITGIPYGGGYGGYGGYGPGATYGTGTFTTNNLGGSYGPPQYPFARSIDEGKSAQDLAYAEQGSN